MSTTTKDVLTDGMSSKTKTGGDVLTDPLSGASLSDGLSDPLKASKEDGVSDDVKKCKKALEAARKEFGEQSDEYVEALKKLVNTMMSAGMNKEVKPYALELNTRLFEQMNRAFPGKSEKEREAFYFEQIRPQVERFYSYASKMIAELGDQQMASEMLNLSMNTKGVLLRTNIEIRKRILSHPDATVRALFEQWREANQNYADAMMLSEEDRKTRGIDLEAVQQELTDIERQMSTKAAEQGPLVDG